MKRLFPVLLLLFCLPASGANKVLWRYHYNQALSEAKKTGKPIYVDAYADWCTWCHQLDKDVYSDPRFVKFMEGFIPLKINVEDNSEGTRFAGDHEITGLPTLLVINSNGQVTNRIGGFLQVDALIADIDGMQRLLEEEQKNTKDINPTFALANEFLTHEMYADAETRFKKILASSVATPAQKESAQFSMALAQYYQQKSDAALASLDNYEATYQNGDSGEDALLLLSEIHLERKSNEKARYYLQEFLRKYPTSGNVNRAQQVLSTLEHRESQSN